MNKESLKIIQELSKKITELEEDLEEEKNINEKNLTYIDNREEYWKKRVAELQAEVEELGDSIHWWNNRANGLMEISKEHRDINGELRKENKHLNELLNIALKDYDELLERVDKTAGIYYKELAKGKQLDDLAVNMFNALEGNK